MPQTTVKDIMGLFARFKLTKEQRDFAKSDAKAKGKLRQYIMGDFHVKCDSKGKPLSVEWG